MDLSLSVDIDSSLLNWSEDVAEMSAAAAGATKKSGSNPGEKARVDSETAVRKPVAVSTTGRTERGWGGGGSGFARLPSFRMDRDGPSAASDNASNPRTKDATSSSYAQEPLVREQINNTGVALSTPEAPIPPPGTSWANPGANVPPHLYQQMMHAKATTHLPTQSNSSTPLQQQQEAPSSATVAPQHLFVHPFIPALAPAGVDLTNGSLGSPSTGYLVAATAAATINNTNQKSSTASQQPNATQPATMSHLTTQQHSVNAPYQAAQHQSSQQIQVTQQPHVPQQQQATRPVDRTNQANTQLHPLAIPSSASCPPLSTAGMAAQGNTYVPMVYNPLLNATQTVAAASNPFMSLLQQQMANSGTVSINQAPSTHQPQPAAAPQIAVAAVPNPGTSIQPTQSLVQPRRKGRTGQQTAAETPPPFLLFDAPCELRTNFIQSQRMHGLPITEDNNSYHYGMAVNGFHPQVNAQDNPILPLSTNMGHMPPVQLVDGRHHRNKRGGARERNEREQKRAQKITELIEKLRVSIEKGGWRVEMKSKYHTLTTCADYVKHLIKTTQEKEAAVEQAKLDLTVKECKLAEDKAVLEGRSDPESVTSSLTASTTGSTPVTTGGDEKKTPTSTEDSDKSLPKKAGIAQVSESAVGSTDSSSGEEGGSGKSLVQNISLDKMSSSVSEMTDSNRGSSDGGNTDKADTDQTGTGDVPSSRSISSTAAVVRGEGSCDRPHGHADVVFKGKRSSRKRKRKELTSLEPNFELDYEEVFLTSNVPQLIATPTGKIVVWNDFFLKATGLTKSEAEGMTIFSIVEQDKLSNLFEMIGQALKRESSSSSQNDGSSQNDTQRDARSTETGTTGGTDAEETSKSRVGDYTAMTLPCISFPAGKDRSAAGSSHHPNPLYMTVTLMGDDDPRKRCFHCVLTDCPGTNGALGSITTELLTLLFTEPDAVESSGSTFTAKKAKHT